MNMLMFSRSLCWTLNEGKMDTQTVRRAKFTECKIEVLITEVEHHKGVLFGGLSGGISNKRSEARLSALTDADATQVHEIENVLSEMCTVLKELGKKYTIYHVCS